MAVSRTITKAEAMQNLLSRDHFIDQDSAVTMAIRIKTKPNRVFKLRSGSTVLPYNVPQLPESLTFNKDAIAELMALPGLAGIRIYPAISSSNKFTVVLVGIDSTGEDIISVAGEGLIQNRITVSVDEAQTCPPYPRGSGAFIETTASTITQEQAMTDLLSRTHFIEPAKAANMVNKLRIKTNPVGKVKRSFSVLPVNVPELPQSITFNKAAIEILLNLPDVAGIRLFPAVNSTNQFSFVLAGVDGSGEDILTAPAGPGQNGVVRVMVDEGQTCPPYPGSKRTF